ncbi:universal stress protein [Roseinatronobacter alkalisoli]|uniref:Universal stress protein n=1 Tax=Roseinatronobacter alkalisoli TaxID=3028235 RepID=A0ABT5T5A5_9RHOB|nr:universal stress protein [Roseinatronobacter sp. HJB301]MDD7970302.1 universal stress protein [Roseinatronobacter sp. HJB301]
MYGRIIVAVDLEHIDQAKALFKRAQSLLDAGGEIRLVHVLEELPGFIAAELPHDVETRRKAEAMVELKALTDPASGLRVVPDLRHGAASGQIMKAAEDSNADLIMIASHKPGLRDYFIGSTAARVVRHATCSVLIQR